MTAILKAFALKQSSQAKIFQSDGPANHVDQVTFGNAVMSVMAGATTQSTFKLREHPSSNM